MITKNYIKQCEKAEEIQKEWKPEKGDYCATRINSHELVFIKDITVDVVGRVVYIMFFIKKDENNREYVYKDNLSSEYTYLPTLEQLFEMVGDYKAQIGRIFLSIMIMKKYKFESIKELVLNAVMEIKYHKIWIVKEWVKIE